MYMYIACYIALLLGRSIVIAHGLRVYIQPAGLTAWRFSYLLYICAYLVLTLMQVPIQSPGYI